MLKHQLKSPHTFHIPVMGTGFTIDTPIRVAKYGINSVISIIDDVLVEQMREKYCAIAGEPYTKIRNNEQDSRSRRIKAYLNLVKRLVDQSSAALRQEPFENGSELTKYYEMLPDSPLKQLYFNMLETPDAKEKNRLQQYLRESAVPGSIDVNIMTKVDHTWLRRGQDTECQMGLARSALKGFALSDLCSSVVFSAGFNGALYSYTSEFDDFYPDKQGNFRKKIILKVSDYRSAEIQGKFLAKKGLWVSEFRIESGLNCGGHAFGSKGNLIGPILEEFRSNRRQLIQSLFLQYKEVLARRGYQLFDDPPSVNITVQGGISNSREDCFLHEYFEVDSTGWGSPFLLVPEAVSVDSVHLKKLAEADEEDVQLSDASPLRVPFWNLRTSEGEDQRRHLIEKGKPGSGCPKGFLTFETGITKQPICTASKVYQKHALTMLEKDNPPEDLKERIIDQILARACLCRDLAGSALQRHNIKSNAKAIVCAGPNITNFSKLASLKEMVDHIYGRISLLKKSKSSGMFLTELKLNIDHLRKEITDTSIGLIEKTANYFNEVSANLQKGITYYKKMIDHFTAEKKEQFIATLQSLRDELVQLMESNGLSPETVS